MRDASAAVSLPVGGAAECRDGGESVIRSPRWPARLLWVAPCLMALSAAALAQSPAAVQPDAIIELWEQRWTLNADGSAVYHEKEHVRLFGDRVFGDYGDQRLAYDANSQVLELISARVKRPDGQYVELPPYARVESGLGGAAGWPAFASLREFIPVISGIEPGCVVELEHKLLSRAGRSPLIDAELRLDHRFEVKQRLVEVIVPPNVTLRSTVSGAGDHVDHVEEKRPDGSTSHTWRLKDLPERVDEPQSPPWTERCPRLRFTTCSEPKDWAAQKLTAIEAVANESPLISRLAGEWTKEASSASEKLAAIREKLSKTFNFVNFSRELRPAPRKASDVAQSNYGLPEEAVALFQTLARAAGVPARAGLLIADVQWDETVPVGSDIADYVLVVEGSTGAEFWRPQHGLVERDVVGAGHTVIASAAGGSQRYSLPVWTAADDCQINVAGVVTLKDDGTYGGRLTFRATGALVSAQALRARDAQSRRVNALARRVLPDADVTEFSVKALAEGMFEVDATLAGKNREKVAGCWALRLAEEGPCAEDVGLPLTHSRRLTPARITSPFSEKIDLRVEWPAAWKIDAKPTPLKSVMADWGAAELTVTQEGSSARVQRTRRIESRDLPPAWLLELRGPFNTLRSEAARTFLFRP